MRKLKSQPREFGVGAPVVLRKPLKIKHPITGYTELAPGTKMIIAKITPKPRSKAGNRVAPIYRLAADGVSVKAAPASFSHADGARGQHPSCEASKQPDLLGEL